MEKPWCPWCFFEAYGAKDPATIARSDVIYYGKYGGLEGNQVTVWDNGAWECKK